MTEHGPAVSRLCVATVGGAGPLHSILESGGFYRLHLTRNPEEGTEYAVAAPGLDEVSLVSDLIDAIHERVASTPGLRQPVFACFHVGIIKLTDEGFGGVGIRRVLALIRDPALAAFVSRRAAAADSGGGRPCLAVAITGRFFEDLRAEGLPGDDWQLVPAADAWLRFLDSKG